MLIYILVDIIIIIYGIFGKVNSSSKRKKVYLFVSFLMLTVTAMLRKYTIGIDLEILYIPKFIQICSLPWEDLTNIHLEVGYLYFCKILSLISSNYQILIIVTSIITVPIYGWFIYKNSKNVVISTTLYIFLNLYFMSLNIVRQEIAVAIILVAYHYLTKGKKVRTAILVLLATTIHASAIICMIFIPLYGVKFKKKYLIASILISLILMTFYKGILIGYSNITSVSGISNNKEYSSYIENEKYGNGIINLNSISTVVLAVVIYLMGYYYIVCVKHDVENDEEEKKQNFALFATMIYTISVTVSLKMVIIARLSYYFLPFMLIIFPEALSISKNQFNKALIMYVSYFFIIIRYVYVLIYLADVLYGVMPFKFFWN